MVHFIKKCWSYAMLRLKWVVCLFFPVKKNKITVSNYFGRGYGDNAKYVVDKLLERKANLQIIWLVKNEAEKKTLPEGVEGCTDNTIKSVYHLLTSGVWLDNCRKEFILLKKRKQFYIQTWHGGGAQKKCEADVIEKLSRGYDKMAKRDSRNIDLMISESRFMTELYHHSFWYDGPVFECGYPRYDMILDHDETLLSKVYEYYGIDRDKELVLYAPTFRADHSFDAYNIDFDRLRRNLKTRFGKEYVILVHLHPNVADVEGGIQYDGTTVINSTFYPDTQELVATSSILIGDYSSINYDFSLMCRPVFRYVSDLEAYRNDRDLYFPFDAYPYPYAENNDELETLVLNFDEEMYLKNLNAFFEKLGSVIQSGAAERIANLILDVISSKNKKEFFQRNKENFVYRNEG